MAITVPNVVKVTGSGVTTVTTSGVTTTTGGTFTISSTADFGVTINTPTDSKSNAYGALGTTQTDDSNAFRQSVFYKENGAGGSGHTATVTYSGSTYPTVYFTEVRGAAAASYDSGSLAAAFDNNGSPHDVTSGTFAQANNAVLTWIGTDGGGTRSYSCSGFTVTQETDGNNYWTGATGYKLVTATTAQLASWVESATRGLMKIAAFKEAAGGTAYDLTVDPASYTLTAAAETVTATRALTIAPASYSLTAQAVNLAVGRVLSVSPASYALSAAAVTTAVGRALNVSPASYSLTAAAQTMTAARSLSISPVSYALTAADVTLTYAPSAKELLIDPASYAVSAADVSFAATRALSIDPASYSLANSAETLSVGRVLSVNPASYALSASAQTLAVGRVLSVDSVAYALTLADVALDYRPSNPELIVDPVSYSLSLPDVEFEYGRSGGGRDDSKAKTRKRVNELNKKILQAEVLEEAQEAVQVAVTKAKSVKKSANQGYDEDEDEALMLLL